MAITYSAQKPGKRSKTWKILFYFFLGIVLLVTAAFLYWNANKKKIIGNKIEKSVRERSAGLYKFKYDRIDLNELGGYFSISNMRVSADSLGLERIIQQKG